MNYFLKKIYLLLIILSIFLDINVKNSLVFSQELVEINLEKEIKKGNFLIGLKQYIGRSTDDKEEFLHFQTKNDVLRVQSSNGIRHKSKEIKIFLKKIPLEKPKIIERLVSQSFASYESARKEADLLEKKGFKPVVIKPNNWKIWMNIDFKNQNIDNFKIERKIVNFKIVPFLTNQYTYQKLDGPISINSGEDIKINNIKYGKNFYLVRDSYGSWTLVQKISFENYLKGVLPHEIGANSPMESLKAQAVIARTWAIYNSNRFEPDNFHLCITTQCQVYKPSASNKNIERAVLSTKNDVLVYGGRPINAFYHASNGGISANSGESWAIQDYPYFISRFDLINIKNKGQIPLMKRRKDLENFFEEDINNFYGKNHYLFRWEKKISNQQINELLRKNNLSNKNHQNLNLEVTERGRSGRVTKLEITSSDSNISIILIKDDIRKYLNFLPSNLFIINKLNDNFWVFNGGGFGHGVGLSQSGAIEMAQQGFHYQKILKKYYKDTKILNFMDLSE